MKDINEGYHGCRMSKNAHNAYLNGLKPLTKFDREDVDMFNIFLNQNGLPSVDMKVFIVLLKKFGYEEKHHTGKNFRLTKFFSMEKLTCSISDLCLSTYWGYESFNRYLSYLNLKINGVEDANNKKRINRFQYIVYRNTIGFDIEQEHYAVKYNNTYCDIDNLSYVNAKNVNIYKVYYSKPKIMPSNKCDIAKKKLMNGR